MTGSSGIDLSRLESSILDAAGVTPDAPWYAAFSGGLDSTVLLHILARIAANHGARLIALHADHGLSVHAADWAAHCQAVCREQGIEYHVTHLRLDPRSGLGLEGEARQARYRRFKENTGGQGWLFTAHHQGDQAETVIERLARGSGPRGLRGMRPVARVYGLRVVRPLLYTPRAAIRAYADQHGLSWVTDASNTDPRYTRNYIRARILPALVERWPDIETALARTASAMDDAQSILAQAAETDLETADDQRIRGDPSLDVEALKTLSPARQRNLLRHWINRELDTTTGFQRLGRIIRAVERHPEPAGGMTWPPLELRIHRHRLYLLRPIKPPPTQRKWDLNGDLDIGPGMVLRARRTVGRGVRANAVRNGVTVTFRRGGERCRLPGRGHRHTLKHILQDAGIPPWQRRRIPLIMVNDEIAAVAGVTCCDPYAAGLDEDAVEIGVEYL